MKMEQCIIVRKTSNKDERVTTDFFSKFNESKAHKDKKHVIMIDKTSGEKMLRGELNREHCDKDNACNFLRFLKIRIAVRVYDAIEVRE